MKIAFVFLLLAVTCAFADDSFRGKTEAALLASKGAPTTTASRGSKTIYSWPDMVATVDSGKVVSVTYRDPEKEKADARRHLQAALNAGEDVAIPVEPERPPMPLTVTVSDSTFKLNLVGMGWSASQSGLGGQKMWVPQLALEVENTSNGSINYLQFRFVFMTGKTKVFDETEASPISYLGTPIPAGITSKTFFAETNVGLIVQRDGWAPGGTNEMGIMQQRYDVLIYYKTQADTGWREYGKLEFFGKAISNVHA